MDSSTSSRAEFLYPDHFSRRFACVCFARKYWVFDWFDLIDEWGKATFLIYLDAWLLCLFLGRGIVAAKRAL